MLNYTGFFVIVGSAMKQERELSRKDEGDGQENILAANQGGG
jgi:hypothetical protein